MLLFFQIHAFRTPAPGRPPGGDSGPGAGRSARVSVQKHAHVRSVHERVDVSVCVLCTRVFVKARLWSVLQPSSPWFASGGDAARPWPPAPRTLT